MDPLAWICYFSRVIRAIIIDDEPSAIRTLELLIKRFVPELTIIGHTSDPLKGLEMLEKETPDLLFLDIQMPVLSGFDLLRKCQDIRFSIIFTTAFDQYAIEAIRFSALDYLLKPIDAEELRQAIQRFIEKKNPDSLHQNLYQNFLHNINAHGKEAFKLAIPTSEGIFFYLPADIIRIEGVNNYSRFYFINQKTLLTSKTLKEYEDILQNHGFLRVHKSHLVNRQSVTGYTADGWLQLSDGSRVEISRRRKEEVLATLKKH